MLSSTYNPIKFIFALLIGALVLVGVASVARADFPIHMIEPGDEVGGPQIDGVVDQGPMGGDIDPSARSFVELYNTPDDALAALLVLINSIEATLDRLEGQVRQGSQTTLKRLVREAVITTRGLTRVGQKIERIRTIQFRILGLQNLSERAQARIEANFFINELALELQGMSAIADALESVAVILDEPLTLETRAQIEESLILLVVLERVLVESLTEVVTP